MDQYFIIDFDSTFTQVEALDELARISLKNHPDREKIYKQIEDFTNASMEGKLSFTQSLENRVKRLKVGSARRFSRTTRKALAADLRSILAPEYATRARDIANRMTQLAHSVATAADLLEETALKGL